MSMSPTEFKVRAWLIGIGVVLLFIVRVACVGTNSNTKSPYYRFGDCSYCNGTGRVDCLYCINGHPPGETYSCAICKGSGKDRCPMCGGSGK